jgi:DNA invertase Pin-like site-specific DNA recombinase
MTTTRTPRVATYLRVSTDDQTVENQRRELAAYVNGRGWTITREYADEGISGSKERRPALDDLLRDAKRRRFDMVIVWSLDRLGRNLRHLVTLLDELQALNIALVSLRDGLDLSSASGRLQMHILAALAEFERNRLRERTISGLRRAKAQGKRLGRRTIVLTAADLASVAGLSVRAAAKALGVSVNTYQRERKAYQQPPSTVARKRTESTPSIEPITTYQEPGVL